MGAAMKKFFLAAWGQIVGAAVITVIFVATQVFNQGRVVEKISTLEKTVCEQRSDYVRFHDKVDVWVQAIQENTFEVRRLKDKIQDMTED